MMRMQEGFVCLRNVRFHAYHGVLEQERCVGNDYILSVRVGYDFSSALTSDDLHDTLNYAWLYDCMAREMQKPAKLVEHVAGRIGQSIFKTFPQATSVWLSITKLNPPIGADCQGAGVEINLINDKTRK